LRCRGIEENPADGSIEKDYDIVGVGSLEKICCRVSLAIVVEDGGADLGSLHVIQRISIIWNNSCLQKPISESR